MQSTPYCNGCCSVVVSRWLIVVCHPGALWPNGWRIKILTAWFDVCQRHNVLQGRSDLSKNMRIFFVTVSPDYKAFSYFVTQQAWSTGQDQYIRRSYCLSYLLPLWTPDFIDSRWPPVSRNLHVAKRFRPLVFFIRLAFIFLKTQHPLTYGHSLINE